MYVARIYWREKYIYTSTIEYFIAYSIIFKNQYINIRLAITLNKRIVNNRIKIGIKKIWRISKKIIKIKIFFHRY